MKNKNKNKIPSNKNFGIVFFIFFMIIGLYPLFYQNELRIWSIGLSFIFLILGIINSNILTPLNKIWHKIGIILGIFISPIIMGIVYFLVVFPTGLFMKILKKNYLGLKFDKNLKSYWITKDKFKSTMKDQF